MIRISILATIFFLSFASKAQNPINFTGFAEGRSFVFSDELPFWMYTNTNGFLGLGSTYGVSVFAEAKYEISPSHSLQAGVGAFVRDGLLDVAQRSDLYLEYSNKWFTLTAGAKSPEVVRQNLSTINDNILFTGNSRALPGILMSTTSPIKLGKSFTVGAEIAHYRLNDERSTRDVNVHYKSLELGWQFNDSNRVTAGLRHYVQWGGVTQEGLELPSGLSDLVTVFFGQSASDFDNFNETTNALGNHLGSYELKYATSLNEVDLELYHNTLFEDRSGRELNNFPDGVWGIHVKPTSSSWLRGILYEYVQTTSQSGRPRATTSTNQQSGGDNYFLNGIYPSGWTYEGQTIGLPFIRPLSRDGIPVSNRSVAHHLGVYSSFRRWEFTGKMTYLRNLGTYNIPLDVEEKQILLYAELLYKTEALGQLRLFLGADALNTRDNIVGVGLGYRYVF